MTISLAGACVALALMKIETTIDGVPFCGPLDHARNILVTRFMRSNATDILFWDDDVDVQGNAIARIAKATRPYIGGVYPKKSDDPEWPIAFDADELWADEDGLIDSPTYLPTGFLRLNRAVFEAMPWAPYRDDIGQEWMAYFSDGVRDGRYGGEDSGFAQEWRRRGGRCYLIPDLTFGHTGTKTWRGNWGEWMRSRAIVDQRSDYSE